MMSRLKTLIFSFFLFFACPHVSGQSNNARIVYVVDSIPVVDDPDPGDSLVNDDVADVTIIRNKDSLQQLGYGQFDRVAFIFTKAYRKRLDSLKMIPSTKQMERKDGIMYLHGTPYSGSIIDYFLNGSKRSEGKLSNGKADGTLLMFYAGGQKHVERHYKMGLTEGMDREFYPDGSLEQEGVWAAGKEEGIWKSFFPNGQIKLYSTYSHGELVDSAFKYYSTGIVRERVAIKNGKVIADSRHSRIDQLMSKSSQNYKDGDIAGAIRYVTKAIELDSSSADAYFSRGTLQLNDLKFDEAIVDLDKALAIEPYMEKALSNRAFARIRKYQFSNSRTLSKHGDVSVLASKDKVDIPAVERNRICDDLNKAVFLGDKTKMIMEALQEYCQ